MSASFRAALRRGLVCRMRRRGIRLRLLSPCAQSGLLDAAPPATLDPHDGCYFERPPERLVLEGYRRWLAGYDSGSVTPWEMTQALYEELLGAAEGRRVLAELSHFVRTLRQCAACPLRSFPFGAHHVCRDECVALGLIAALQHDDQGAVATSAFRRSPARRARPMSPRRRPALPTRWPAPATIFCRFRKARSKTCFHVPAPNAAPFTEETENDHHIGPRAAFRTTGGDRRLGCADGRDLRAAGQGGHRPARR